MIYKKKRKKITDHINNDQLNNDQLNNSIESEYILENNVFSVTKNKLEKIINSTEIEKEITINIINDAIYRTNYIVYHTYNFIKVASIILINNNEEIHINKQLIMSIMTHIVSKRITTQGIKPNLENQTIISKLKAIYDEHYLPLINQDEIVNNDYLTYILSYEANDMLTCIKNNIEMHYTHHLYKLAKIVFNYNEKLSLLDPKSNNYKVNKKQLYEQFKKFYTDIVDVKNNFSSDAIYHDAIKTIKKRYIPKKKTYSKDSISYDIKVNPLTYLKYFYKINLFFENRSNNDQLLSSTLNSITLIKNNNLIKSYINKFSNGNINNNNSNIKLFNFLPIRRSIIPRYITLDTCALISLFFREGKNKGKYLSKIDEYKDLVWSKIFKLDNKMFKKNGYNFNYLLKTDGYGVSIVFGYYDPTINKYKKKKTVIIEEDYIDKQDNVQKILQDKNYVVMDPNKEDLIYCLDKNGNYFRYTNKQRKFETQSKRKSNRIEYLKKTTNTNANSELTNFIELRMKESQNRLNNNLLSNINDIIKSNNTLISLKKLLNQKKSKEDIILSVNSYVYNLENNKEIQNIKILLDKHYKNLSKKIYNPSSVKAVESLLSSCNSKTSNLEEFKKYIMAKEKVNSIVASFYKDIIHRKYKLDIYGNKNRSEMRMVNNFRDKFGNSEETIVIMGDWSENNNIIKGKEPTINKRIRYLLRRDKYKVYLIDEYHTSKLCNKCESEVVNEYKRNKLDENPVWGLVCCKNKNCVQNLRMENPQIQDKIKCRFMNRDRNSVLNMHKIVRNLIVSNTRPQNYSRLACAI